MTYGLWPSPFLGKWTILWPWHVKILWHKSTNDNVRIFTQLLVGPTHAHVHLCTSASGMGPGPGAGAVFLAQQLAQRRCAGAPGLPWCLGSTRNANQQTSPYQCLTICMCIIYICMHIKYIYIYYTYLNSFWHLDTSYLYKYLWTHILPPIWTHILTRILTC